MFRLVSSFKSKNRRDFEVKTDVISGCQPSRPLAFCINTWGAVTLVTAHSLNE
ncbi:uncharacterized protein DS421_16g539150 [Arachis hypogaea]|nr:uncharacterized protein DS421_16g539150 [Arachis hypogaea]